MVKQYQDTGYNTTATAPTLFEYDTFGNQVKKTLALNDAPSQFNSPVLNISYATEMLDDGIYKVLTQTRYNAEGSAVSKTNKVLISCLSSMVSKNISVDARGNSSISWSIFSLPSTIKSFNTTPTSEVTAETITVDGLTIYQKDLTGVSSSLQVQTITNVAGETEINYQVYRYFMQDGLKTMHVNGQEI